MTKNMSDFEKGVALILTQLYEAFPQKIAIDVNTLESGADEASLKNYAATMEFLAEEGFIRSGASISHGLLTPNVVLTTKGLDILNSTPESLREKTTLGQKLMATLKTGGKEALSEVVKLITSASVSGVSTLLGG